MHMRNPVVFVVDDEKSVRRAIVSMLDASGFETIGCSSAAEFLKTYTQQHTGCVILDVRMPNMDGLQLQQYLLQNNILIPVIMLTGHGDVPMAVKSMDDGAFYFLQKPADVDILVEKVTEAIDIDRQRRMQSAEVDEIQQQLTSLTSREREVMDQLIQGKTTASIASALGTKESTIRVQRATILKKMRADSVIDLLRMNAQLTE